MVCVSAFSASFGHETEPSPIRLEPPDGSCAAVTPSSLVTGSVMLPRYVRGMERALEPGDEIRCLHCRRWHPVYQPHTEGTVATLLMLYFDCRGLRYFAGFVGSPSRHPSRAPQAT